MEIECEHIATLCSEKWKKLHEKCRRVYGTETISPTVTCVMGGGQEVKILDRIYNSRDARVYDEACPTLRSERQGLEVVEPTTMWDGYNQRLRENADYSGTITGNVGADLHRNGQGVVEKNFRIRKLTPRECYRLMGFTDRDYAKAKFNACDQEEIVELFLALDDKLQRRVMTKKEYRQYRILFEGKKKERMSDSQLYKQAGNSIVVQVLESIFGQML